MPTFDAENQVRVSGERRPYVSVSRQGKLLPEVREVIALIARQKQTLATGHSSPAELLMLLQEGRKAGVTRMVVTHAMLSPVSMSLEQQKEATKLGAYLEFVYNALLPSGGDKHPTLPDYIKAIRAAGAEHCILSSVLGQAVNPVHTVGWKAYLDG